MANYNNIKATIDGNIFENGSELITGSILNDVLNQMVDAFAVGYQYKGVATPSLNPGSPDARVFYLTTTPGTYTRFGGLTVGSGELALLRWDSSWHKDSFSVGGGGGGGDVNVIDNLNSSSPIDALSANQGRILNGKIAELVLKVDSSNLIAEFASSFAELSEQYPLIYVDGHTKILPVSGESTGWLFETPSGWRIVTSDLDSEFGSGVSFEEVLSGIASVSLPIYTKPSTGIPESDLAQGVKDKLTKASGAVRYDTAQSLTDEQKEIARGNITAMANTPSGDPCHYLYEDAGAVWNSTTGYWELNGLTDITTEQMRAIYNIGVLDHGKADCGYYAIDIRTNITKPKNANYNLSAWPLLSMCRQSHMEVFAVGRRDDSVLYCGALSYPFYSSDIKRVKGILDITNTGSASRPFENIYQLESINIRGLKISVSFKGASELDAASVAYMINNAQTNAITITLHATAYARAMADPAVQEALAAKTNVTLASE